ncbi:MAG: hypothetical protein ACP6IY_19180 [Promethearchaeia archaeon]
MSDNISMFIHSINDYEKIIKNKLKELTSKGVKCNFKKFNYYKRDYTSQISILNLAKYIGLQCGYENVEIEPNLRKGDADIFFHDGEDYFIQIKTPKFFASYSYGNDLIRLTNRFCNEVLLRSNSRFSLAYINKDKYHKLMVKEINRPELKASLGIVLYNPFFPSLEKIIFKFQDLIEKAFLQLIEIEKLGRKIIIIDITYYYIASLYAYLILQGIFMKFIKNKTEKIDGLAIYSWVPLESANGFRKFDIIPVLLSENVNSKVFRRKTILFQGQLIAFPFYGIVKSYEKRKLSLDKGYLKIDGVEYANFKELLNRSKY